METSSLHNQLMLKLLKRITTKYYVKGFYRLLWAARKFLRAKNDIYPINDSIKLKIDSNHYYQWMMASTNYYGFGIKKLLYDYLKDRDIFIDVGANIGYISLVASSIVGEDGWVICFEPDPRASRTLKENILLNNLKNVVLVDKACADREGTVTFNLASHLGWSTAIRDTASLEIVEQIRVPTYKLDGVIKEDFVSGRKIKLIKIDVEGYEPDVLGGATEIIKRNETAFIIEINRERLGGNNSTIDDVLKHFEGGDYLVYWIDEKRGIVNSLNAVKLVRMSDSTSPGGDGDIFIAPANFMRSGR